MEDPRLDTNNLNVIRQDWGALDDRANPTDLGALQQGVQMGDRVTYHGSEHASLVGQPGTVKRLKGTDAILLMQNGHTIQVAQSGLQKSATATPDETAVGTGDDISEWADRIFPEENEMEQQPQQNHVEAHWDVVSAPLTDHTHLNHDPVLDGPNPDGPDFADNAGNSYEHEVALTRWVGMAVDHLNRGEDPKAVVALLAKRGCPDPEQIVQTAIEQPTDQPPVTDEAAAAPQTPAPAVDEGSTSQMPMGVQARTEERTAASKGLTDLADERAEDRVTVAGMGEGRRLGSYTDMWDHELVKVALDSGQTVDVHPSNVEEVAQKVDEPVEEIQKFIDSFPPVNPEDRESVKARIENIHRARVACRTAISDRKVSEAEQYQLDAIQTDLEIDESEMRDFLKDVGEVETAPYSVGVAGEQQSMGHDAKASYFMDDEILDQREAAEATDWKKEIDETAPIMVAEAPEADIVTGHVLVTVADYIERKTASLVSDIDRTAVRMAFKAVATKAAEERKQRIAAKTTTAKTASAEDNDGPAEGLFLRS